MRQESREQEVLVIVFHDNSLVTNECSLIIILAIFRDSITFYWAPFVCLYVSGTHMYKWNPYVQACVEAKGPYWVTYLLPQSPSLPEVPHVG